MAWRRPGDKSLSEPMMESLLTHICVTRPQWVDTLRPEQNASCIMAASTIIRFSWILWYHKVIIRRFVDVYSSMHIVRYLKSQCFNFSMFLCGCKYHILLYLVCDHSRCWGEKIEYVTGLEAKEYRPNTWNPESCWYSTIISYTLSKNINAWNIDIKW